MTNPEQTNIKIGNLKNNFLYTWHITQFNNTNDFLLHAVWYEDQAIQLPKFSMSQEVKKGL